MGGRKLYLVGHSHLDVAWVWPIEESREVIKELTERMVKMLKKHKDLTYVQSTALYYLWLSQDRPDLIKEIKELIKEGKWEVVGGSWVECDCIIPSGESLIRQFLYGKKLIKELLGTDVKVAWFPDTFGFPASLPQILKGCGIEYFVTQKLNWNDTVMFPYNLFRWSSPDGSEVLAYQTLGGYVEDPRQVWRIKYYFFALHLRHRIPELLMLYGLGDHGGGPTEEMLEFIESSELLKGLSDLGVDEVKHVRTEDYLRMVKERYGNSLPKYVGELYLQFHRGTYTSEAKIKELIKDCEYLLEILEKLLTIKYLALGKPYDTSEVESLWRDLLTSQFHDVAAGSLSKIPYMQFLSILTKLKGEVEGRIYSVIKELVGDGGTKSLIVFNPLPKYVELITEVPEVGIVRLGIEGLTLKSVSLNEVEVVKEGSAKAVDLGDEVTLENDYVKLVISKRTGEVVSLYSKVLGKEFLGDRGIRFELFDDVPTLGRATAGTLSKYIDYVFDCWELFHLQRIDGVKYRVLNEATKVEVIESGGARASVGIEYEVKLGNEYLKLRHVISVYDGKPWVEGKVFIDWGLVRKLLKLAIDLNYWSEYLAVGQPFAYVLRRNPASPYSSLYDRAVWEGWFSEWLDYSNGELGLGLVCGRRFGYDLMGSTLRLTLLRGPKLPPDRAWNVMWTPELLETQEPAERGNYFIKYYLVPHKGDWVSANIPVLAEELVNGPYVVLGNAEPKTYSPIKVSSSKLLVPTIKLSEVGNDVIVRLFNPVKEVVSTEVSIDANVDAVLETNLIEEVIKELGKDSSVSVELMPLKLVTLRFRVLPRSK